MAQTNLPQSGKYANAFVMQPGLVRHCHVQLEGMDKPVAAIEYQGHTYSFFKAFSSWEEAEKIASRLKDLYIITNTRKGWAIWAFEY